MPNEIIVDLGSTLRAINEMGKRVRNTKPLASTIAETMLSDISQHFEDEEGPGGQPWKQLSDVTIEERREKGYWPGKILQRQGRGSGLLGSLQPVYDKYSTSVVTNKVYAAAHNFGLGARSVVGSGRSMPELTARPFAYLSTDAKQEINLDVQDYILGK